jgi:predicted outer membrane protein
MKNKPVTLLTSAALALCGILLSAPHGLAAEKETLNAFDMRFIKRAAADDTAEVKLAELGVKKASSPDVKALAEMIVADHTAGREDLSKLAAAKGVQISNVVDPKDAATFQKLEQASGAEFDKLFLAEMVKSHKACLSNYEEASTGARDVDVRAFAGEALPVLRSHLKKARELSPPETASVAKEPDNTARNVRDRDPGTLTPLDQGSSKSDTEITAQIRKEIIATKNMSVNAQNVKIITQNGKVTLRGPVNTAEEKSAIADIATRFVRSENVVSQLEVK